MATNKAAGKSRRMTPKSSQFGSYLAQVTGALPGILPLIHITEWQYAKVILETGRIQARKCEFFSQYLASTRQIVYCFYGRPAYQPRAQIPSMLHARAPVALILASSSASPKPARIYPFDTGAFFNGVYKTHFDERWTDPHPFFLGNSLTNAQRLVKDFYTENANYLLGQVKKASLDDPFTHFEVDAYLSLISDRSLGDQDWRSSSVEVQFECNLELKDYEQLRLIVPENLLRNGGPSRDLATRVAGDANCIGYELTRGSMSEWYGRMSGEAIKVIQKIIKP